MSQSFLHTDNFIYACADCGFNMQSATRPIGCPVCGSDKVALVDEMLKPLRNFVSGSLVEVSDLRMWIAIIPVTQIIWRLITGEEPFYFKGDDLPVESVSYDDCTSFVAKLNRNQVVRESGYVFRLPTSDEWSKVGGRGRRKFPNLAWFWENSDGKTHPVATKKPNPLGLYDMFGNVWEWCRTDDSADAGCCGGCWCSDEEGCQLVERWPRETRCNFIGLRLCAESRR